MSTETTNESEEFVYQISRRSALSLWAYPNPQGRGGKELCDVLLVCDPDVVIISVKDIRLGNSGGPKTDYERWSRKAIDASIKQIFGAERYLAEADVVVQKNGAPGIPLPSRGARRVHRVAVALGAEGQLPVFSKDDGRGFVHVLERESFDLVLRELDTITDLVDYLLAKEELLDRVRCAIVEGGEQNLLALYLNEGRKFPHSTDVLIADDSLWRHFASKPEVLRRKAADQDSYVWDRNVETLSRDILSGWMLPGPTFENAERAVRLMSKESRFQRRLFGGAFKEFLELSSTPNASRSRMLVSPSGVVYVFLLCAVDEDREFRAKELMLRCFVARGQNKDFVDVAGIATEVPAPGQGFSMDVVCLQMEQWTDDDQEKTTAMQKNLGYFLKPTERRFRSEEYPDGDD